MRRSERTEMEPYRPSMPWQTVPSEVEGKMWRPATNDRTRSDVQAEARRRKQTIVFAETCRSMIPPHTEGRGTALERASEDQQGGDRPRLSWQSGFASGVQDSSTEKCDEFVRLTQLQPCHADSWSTSSSFSSSSRATTSAAPLLDAGG